MTVGFYLLYYFPDRLLGSVCIVEAESVFVTKAPIGQIEETRNECKILLGGNIVEDE